MDNKPDAQGQNELLSAILDSLPEKDAPVEGVLVGSHLVAVDCAPRTGMASCQGPHGLHAPRSAGADDIPGLPESGLGLARWLVEPPQATPQARSLGLAAVNALLAPPANLEAVKGQDLILERGEGRRVAVVGHFPFVERMGERFADLSVLELAPRDGDLPAHRATDVLPAADVVAMTGTALLNGTMASLLDLCRPEAFVMVLGPSTPFAPALFDLGVDAVAGAVVDDPEAVRAGIRKGLPFKALRGSRALVWRRG